MYGIENLWVERANGKYVVFDTNIEATSIQELVAKVKGLEAKVHTAPPGDEPSLSQEQLRMFWESYDRATSYAKEPSPSN